MSGPTVTVTLDASAVAGLFRITESLTGQFDDKGLEGLADQMRSVRLALNGALRANGWVPVGGCQWKQRTPVRGRR